MKKILLVIFLIGISFILFSCNREEKHSIEEWVIILIEEEYGLSEYAYSIENYKLSDNLKRELNDEAEGYVFVFFVTIIDYDITNYIVLIDVNIKRDYFSRGLLEITREDIIKYDIDRE